MSGARTIVQAAERMRRPVIAASAMLVWLLAPHRPVWAQGCAMCATALSGPSDPLAKGMAISIVFMLLVPNLLILSIGGWIFYTYRRAGLAQAAIESAGRLEQPGQPPETARDCQILPDTDGPADSTYTLGERT